MKGFNVGQWVIILHGYNTGEVYQVASEPFIWQAGERYISPHIGKIKMKRAHTSQNGMLTQAITNWVSSRVVPGAELYICHPVAWMCPYEDPDTWVVTERDRVLET